MTTTATRTRTRTTLTHGAMIDGHRAAVTEDGSRWRLYADIPAYDDHPASQRVVAEAHQDSDGWWVAATWDQRAAQYTSSDGYCYTYGRSLAALRRLGIRAHRSALSALRASMV